MYHVNFALFCLTRFAKLFHFTTIILYILIVPEVLEYSVFLEVVRSWLIGRDVIVGKVCKFCFKSCVIVWVTEFVLERVVDAFECR